jgi:hypothetical protein
MFKRTFHKCFLLCILCMAMISVRAQFVSLPDTNFAHFLSITGYSSCLTGNNTSGWYLDTVCAIAIPNTYINCSYQGIRDLTGIRFLKNLRRLGCSSIPVTTLPALPDHLIYLDCSYNNALVSLPAMPSTLDTLNCSHCPWLRQINSLGNSLTYLDCNLDTNVQALMIV